VSVFGGPFGQRRPSVLGFEPPAEHGHPAVGLGDELLALGFPFLPFSGEAVAALVQLGLDGDQRGLGLDHPGLELSRFTDKHGTFGIEPIALVPGEPEPVGLGPQPRDLG
jgi:hypothetical protein